ncbi:hypothetical protein [Polynucleobacter asymbioticus]|uniref:hypothetical protein n=1 Tax=Polynucleobacter asymbioticus TaxID=576611 RepID=UPI0011607C01|nr:hypothetical protein [Polynucleobacter asymbioticus]
MKSKYAPIIITVYDRIDHFRQCVESLLENPESSESDLFISSDGPTDPSSAERVERVRNYIKVIQGFKSVTPFLPKENTNFQVMRDVLSFVSSNYDSYILTEDDNIFSRSALKFLNDALNTYAGSVDVFAVSAFLYPNFPIDGENQIFLPCCAGYGTGHWSYKNIFTAKSERKLSYDAMRSINSFSKINRVIPSIAPLMQSIALGNLAAGDVAHTIHCITENKVCVFPPISLVRNTGYDGSGIRCGEDRRFSEQNILNSDVILDPLKKIVVKHEHRIWIFNFFGGRLAAIRSIEAFFVFNLGPIWLKKAYLKTVNPIKSLIKSMLV